MPKLNQNHFTDTIYSLKLQNQNTVSTRNKFYAIVIITTMFLLSACQEQHSTKVIQVIDGDTVIIENGFHVRYIGIDAPEKNEAYYLEATLLNKKLVEGKSIRLEKDTSEKDKYGRILGYIYVDDIFINAEIVRLGYAHAKAYPPDIKHQWYLQIMETEARKTKRGIWK